MDRRGFRPSWDRVIDRVCALVPPSAGKRGRRRSGTPPPSLDRKALVQGLRAMAAPLREIAGGAARGIEQAVLDHLRPGLLAQAARLQDLR